MTLSRRSIRGFPGGAFAVTRELLRRFLPGDVFRIAAGLVLLLTASGVALLQPWPLKLVLDCVVGSHSPPRLLSALVDHLPGGTALLAPSKPALLSLFCAGLLLIELALGALNVASAYLLNSVALRMVFKLRCALFDHVQQLSLSFHDRQPVGDSLCRITWDSYCVQAVFSEGMIPAVTAGTTLLGIAFVMVTRDPALGLATLGVSIPLIVLIRRLEKPMTQQSTLVHEHESEVSTRVQETLSGIRAVQAFSRERFESERFRSRADASLQANLRLTITQTASQAIIGLVLAIGTAAVIWLGARGVIQNRTTPGDLVLLAAYVAMIFKPLETLAYTAGAVQSAAAGARRVLSILEEMPAVTDGQEALPLPFQVNGGITFESVSFAYRHDLPTLRDIRLQIPAGSSVAVVGPSGAGKTTLASLLIRFYDPDSGRITLDNLDLRSVTLSSLRHNVALVTQDPILFAASIRENIAYGKPGADREEIEAAARAAGAHAFISGLPEGYETSVGERGAALSGGQRQRLAIARAFLKDAPVLVLDEPTSALDAETEAALMQALKHLMEGRTTIIIAHRLSTVRSADRIVVMKAGGIEESGSHAELLAKNGLYARMHELQCQEENNLLCEVGQ